MRHHIFHARMVFLMIEAACLGFFNDSVGKRMRIVLLKAGRQPQHIVFRKAAEGDDLGYTRFGIGERTGLVENNRVRFGHRLQEAAAFDGYAVFVAFAHTRKHGNRDRELECAREIDH